MPVLDDTKCLKDNNPMLRDGVTGDWWVFGTDESLGSIY